MVRFFRQNVVLWVLALVSLLALSGCDARVIGAGHVTSLVLSVAMVWATLNLDKARR